MKERYSNKILRILFVILIFIQKIQNSFIIFPLISKKNKNIDINLDDESISKYLDNFFDENKFLGNWGNQTISTEITIGTPKLTYSATFNDNKYSFLCSTIVNHNLSINKNLFNKSSTINTSKIVRPKHEHTFDENPEINWIGQSSDYFYFNYAENEYNLYNNTTIEKGAKISFDVNYKYYAKNEHEFNNIEINEINDITIFDFPINLLNDIPLYQFCVFKYLNEIKIIDKIAFKFEYYKNKAINISSEIDEVGRIIIGNFNNISNKKLKLFSTNFINSEISLDYKIYLSSGFIKLEDNTYIDIHSNSIKFVFDQGIIQGTFEYKQKIFKEFFEKFEDGKMCKIKTTTFGFYERKVCDVIVCNKELINKHKNSFPILQLNSADLNITFEFNYDDLFRNYKNETYFMVIFAKINKDDTWIFGQTLFKKYELIFDLDNNTVNMIHEYVDNTYTNKIRTTLKIIFEIIIVCALILIGYMIGIKIKANRKLRARELDDNYDYIQSELKENL